jgi:hypothetical protein
LVEAIVAATGVAVTSAAIEAASTKVATAMGITLPAGESLATFDPYAAGVTAATKLAVQQANNNVMTVVKAMASAAEGAGVSAAEANKLAFAGMYEFVDDNASAAIDFADTATMDLVRADVQTEFNTYAATTAGAALNGGAGLNIAEFVTIATAAQVEIEEVTTQIKALTTTSTDAEKAAIFKVVSVLADTVETYAKNVTDGVGGASLTFDTTSQMLNTAPTDIKLSGSTTTDTTYSATSAETVAISESASSLVVGTLTGVDNSVTGTLASPVTADAASALTFAIAGGADSASFELSGGVLSFKSQPDYETKTSYSVAISATDASGASKVETFTVSITDDTTEGGAFGISSDTVTWTDYNPAVAATSLVAATAASDVSHSVMTSTTGSQVSVGSSGYGGALNLQNLKNLFDDDAATIGKSPNLNFTLDTVPTGSGSATIKATIIQGRDATRSGTESEISVEVTVGYFGDGTTATLTMPAGGTGAVSYTTAAGTTASYTVTNVDADAFSITAANASTGDAAVLSVKMGSLYDVFVNSDLGAPDMLRAGDYNIALETTLPLQNYANETVTKFTGMLAIEDGNTVTSIVGTDGADTITGTSAAEAIAPGAGKDTISTGGGADYIVLATGTGSTTLANANTVAGDAASGWTNGTDKFALDGLTFAELTVAADATTAGDTNISITATGEYLMTVTGLDYGYITSNDFILTDDIV